MIKNVIKIALIILIIALASCSTKSIKEPEQLGKQVFEILKNISNENKENYISNFISIEEIRELGKNEKLVKDESTRNEMTSMLKEKWISQIEKEYNKIKEKAGEVGLNWNKIEYLDFVYELKERGGMKMCEGALYFKFNEKSFKIEAFAVWDGNEYKLAVVENLYEQQ